MLHSKCLQIWKTQQWPQDWKRSVLIPTPKKGNGKERLPYSKTALISYASTVMLKILQARLQQYLNWGLPDVQAGFRKGRGTRDQIANIQGSHKKQENSRKTSSSASLTTPNLWLCASQPTRKLLKRWEYQTTWPASWEICMQVKKQPVVTGHGTIDRLKTGKGVHLGCILSPCLFNLYAESIIQIASWMKHKLESRLLGDISVTSDTQVTPLLWQNMKNN